MVGIIAPVVGHVKGLGSPGRKRSLMVREVFLRILPKEQVDPCSVGYYSWGEKCSVFLVIFDFNPFQGGPLREIDKP